MNNHQLFDKSSKEYLEFCYKEYTRLAEIQENHLQSVFSDLKLLSVVGGLLAWKPLLDALGERSDPVLLTLGFLAILFVAMFVFLFDFMRQSIMLFYTNQMKYYEKEIRQLLDLEANTLFSSVQNWTQWMHTVHEPIAQRFFGCFFIFALLFPTMIILSSAPFSNSIIYASAYLLVAIVMTGLMLQCFYIITRRITNKLEE